MLTFTQRQTLRTFILADPVLGPWGVTNTDATQKLITDNLNSIASPNFTVFKGFVNLREIADQMDGAETASLTAADHSRVQTYCVLFVEGVFPSILFSRVYLDDIFSAKPITRARLGNQNNIPGVFWKRLATRLEKLFATGTGTDTAPATLVVEGMIGQQEVSDTLAGL